MKKLKRRKERQRRTKHSSIQIKPQTHVPVPVRRSRYPSPKTLIGGVVTLVGLALGATVLVPRPVVELPVPLSDKDPSSAVFYVANNGFISLESVTTSIAICRFGNLAGEHWPCDYTSALTMPGWANHTLREDERFPVVISDIFKTGGTIPNNADIAIKVDYSPWFIPIIRTKMFRFISKVAPDGTMTWLSMPLA